MTQESLKQFHTMKAQHPDAVLLFRCQDYYECYEQDAQDCSRILGLPVISQDGVQTVSFNCYQLDFQLPKLVRAGRRVAICDALDSPQARRLTKRGTAQ